jgi:hypothetical protein
MKKGFRPSDKLENKEKMNKSAKISISSVNTSEHNDKVENTSNIDGILNSISDINLDEMENSFSPGDLQLSSVRTIKRKDKEKERDIENTSPQGINIKKRKLVRKMQNSKINETNLVLSSVRAGINIDESSISIVDDRNICIFTGKEESSLVNIKNNIMLYDSIPYTGNNTYNTCNDMTPNPFTEEKLRNLVKQSRRLSQNSQSGGKKLIKIRNSKTSDMLCSNLNLNVIEIDNHEKYSNFELSKMLFELIHNAGDCSIIHLPPRYISFPHLVLSSSIEIRGSPGTLVEINNGVIVVSSKKEHTKVSIHECSFVFNLEITSSKEKMKSDDIFKNFVNREEKLEKSEKLPYQENFNNLQSFNNPSSFRNSNSNINSSHEKFFISLFNILPNTTVEISDCDFRAIVHEEENILPDFDPKRLFWETLFYIPKKESSVYSNLHLQSTICSNFYKILETQSAGEISIDHCHFSETISNGLTVYNTKKFSFLFSTINNTLTAIDLIYEDENTINKSSGKFSMHEVRIRDSEITQNRSYGLKISTNGNKVFSKCLEEVEIRKNNFRQNKTGILISKLTLSKLILINNEIKSNIENGIEISQIEDINSKTKNYIDASFFRLLEETNNEDNSRGYNITSSSMESNIMILKNIIKDHKNRIGIKLERCNNLSLLFEDNKILSNLIGLSFRNFSNGLIFMCSNNINENFETGISVNNFSGNCKILISNSRLTKNLEQALVLTNPGNPSTTPQFPHCYIKNSEITSNKICGVNFVNFMLSLENTLIQDNGTFAVQIPLEINKNLIKLINYDPQRLSSQINNAIGGNWGVIENKKSICANGNCSIL